MTETSLKKLINEFSPENLVAFFRAKRLRNFTEQKESLPQFTQDTFSDVRKIGFLKFSEVEELHIFTIKVNKDLTERSGKKAQYELAKQILKHYDNLYDGIFAFHDPNGNFRFSLIYVNYYGTRTKLSNFRRFTYFVSPKFTNNTFIMRMRDGDFTTLDGIKEAFSVEKVTKEFYQDVSNWYDWALKTAKFPKAALEKENGPEMSVIRLITRMIFIWFMKVKGFISADLFEKTKLRFLIKDIEDDGAFTYYNAILQNLFFAILSQEVPKRKFRADPGFKNRRSDYGDPNAFRYKEYFLNESTYSDLFKNIPFLNGGLFSNLDIRKSDENSTEVFIDGFSDNPKNRALLPNQLFFGDEMQIDLNAEYGTTGRRYSVRGLLQTFERFNFTIDENTPDDQDIALDPELLGQVFENLLAKVNPETSEAARKETGSFYTPREIVDFMVDESLIAFFETSIKREIPEAQNLEDRLRDLLAYQGEMPIFTPQETDLLIRSIDSVKVLDPACGSGAFPMGMLNKLVFVLGRLDPDNKLWKDLQLTKALQELEKAGLNTDPAEQIDREREIERAFDQRVDSDYGRKLYLIRNAIYGVDIQPMAIQISKLRFFISLIVEQQMDLTIPEQNFGILPLPNLETKFVTANSLIHLYQKPVNMVVKPKVEVTAEVIENIDEIRNFYRQYIASTSKILRDGLRSRAIDLAYKVNRAMKGNPDFEPIKVNLLFNEGKTFPDFDKYIPHLQEETPLQIDLFQGAIPELKEKLQRVHERHFTASNKQDREKLEKEDARIRQALRKELIEQPALGQSSRKIATLLSDWQPFDQNSVAGFFDPEWMFDVKDGFDIVIGNPPYIQLQKLRSDHAELQQAYANAGYQVHDSMGDIYALFYELGYCLLKWRTGILAYITSNKWMRAGYGKKLRDFFNIHTDPIKLIDFAGQRVFTTATVDVNIMIFRKSKLGTPTQATTVKEDCLNVLGDYIKQNSQAIQFKTGETWVIMDAIEKGIKEKIEALGTPLSEWDIQINYGIKTGFNEAFIISGQKKDELIAQDPKSAEIIRPILRGRDIKRYFYTNPDLWIINVHDGIKSKGVPRIKVEDYPSVKEHLDKYYKKLSTRYDKGTTPYNLRSCEYLEEFFKQKIIYPCIMRYEPSFTFDKDGAYFTYAPGNIITGNNLKYLIGYLCSKTYFFALRKYYMGGGIEGELKTNRILILPVPLPENNSFAHEIIGYVDDIYGQSSNLIRISTEIEDLIQMRLGLNSDERNHINNYVF
ncbi:MAG: Eco57I restriction-modification methylase domain-containing protein [Anaerolineaceae bacterium]|jgi:type I restriction-modification system DNA methylase subunit